VTKEKLNLLAKGLARHSNSRTTKVGDRHEELASLSDIERRIAFESFTTCEEQIGK
jgi:hypothetical protein